MPKSKPSINPENPVTCPGCKSKLTSRFAAKTHRCAGLDRTAINLESARK